VDYGRSFRAAASALRRTQLLGQTDGMGHHNILIFEHLQGLIAEAKKELTGMDIKTKNLGTNPVCDVPSMYHLYL
jgi:hypothetical protein